MPSVKCSQCGLVNFDTASRCKRCSAVLNEFAPVAQNKNYQNPTENFQPYQMPPPPVFYGDEIFALPRQSPNCVTCGDTRNVAFQDFKKDYVPPIAYLGFFSG